MAKQKTNVAQNGHKRRNGPIPFNIESVTFNGTEFKGGTTWKNGRSKLLLEKIIIYPIGILLVFKNKKEEVTKVMIKKYASGKDGEVTKFLEKCSPAK